MGTIIHIHEREGSNSIGLICLLWFILFQEKHYLAVLVVTDKSHVTMKKHMYEVIKNVTNYDGGTHTMNPGT